MTQETNNQTLNTENCHTQRDGLNRRDFIRRSALIGAGLAATPEAMAEETGEGSKSKRQVGSKGKRKLGDLEVTPIGLGCMSMTSGSYNPSRSKEEMIPVIRGAVELGMNFFDTAEVYGPFTNEELVGEALAPFRDHVVIASKFGFGFKNGQRAGRNSKPAYIRQAVEGMLRRLKTDRIDLLYLHRLDPDVSVEEVAETVKKLIKEGKALNFGLSEVAPNTLRRAHKVQPVAALQSEYSLVERAPENRILDTCEELGVGFVPWGPVCRGFLGDKFNEYSRFSEDSRFASVPYYTPEAIANNMRLLNLVRDWAVRKDATPAQISLAWSLAERPNIVHIAGTTKLHHVQENLGALDITFTDSELSQFRREFSEIKLVGVRSPSDALEDQ